MATNRVPDGNGGIAPSVLTTTGDILYASAAQVPARLAVGSTSQVLTVAGGVPTWATPAAGGTNTPYFSAILSSDITATQSAWTELVLNTKSFDSATAYSTTTGRFTPATSGKYLVTFTATFSANGANRWEKGMTSIRKNGTSVIYVENDFYSATYTPYSLGASSQIIVSLNGSTDYVSIYYYAKTTTGIMYITSSDTVFSAFKISE